VLPGFADPRKLCDHVAFLSPKGRSGMPDHIYKSIKVTGSSATGIEEAVNKALAKAGESLRGLRWFEVCDIRGSIEDGNTVWQVTVEIGFTMDD
jgi:hypothetical protein